MRIVISDGDGKSYQAELPKDKESVIIGKKIGDTLDGNLIGAAGYSLELTGGSDTSGFPMRSDISGSGRKMVLLSDGIGFNAENDGERRRKQIRGNTYSSEIMQINAKVKQKGASDLATLFPKKENKEKK